MTTEQLSYVLEINRCRSINKASKTLFVSQPSLSGVLKNLEEELGYKIFERTSTGIVPTTEGQEFIRFAERVFAEYRSICQITVPAETGNALRITAACSSLFSIAFFDFKKAHPTKERTLDIFREASIYPSLQDLTSHASRLVITYVAMDCLEKYENYAQKNDLELTILRDGLPIRVIMAKDHPLATKEHLELTDLKGYPYVAYQGVDVEETLGAICDDDTDVQYISTRSSYYDAIRVGGYVSTSLQIEPGEDERLGIVCRPCDGFEDRFAVALFTTRGHILSEREQQFIGYVQNKMNAVFGVPVS